MDPSEIIALFLRMAQGDEDAEKEVLEQAIKQILFGIIAVERLTDLRIEPGSFLLGMAYEAHSGLDYFAHPQNVKHIKELAEKVRELYAEG